MRQEPKKHIYPNGLTLLVDEAPQLRSVSIAAWVKTGSRNEDLSSAGLCHFLEHMLFKGSKRKGPLEIAKAVDRVGGDFNAFTSREHTCFHFFLPAKELQLGSTLLKEILFRPMFEKKEIERERQVILQEIAMSKESPEEEAFDRFLEKYFGKHPLGRQILGTEKTVSAFTRARLFHFFYQHYCPENMVISVSGAIRFDKVRREFAALGEGLWPNRKKSDPTKAQWGVDPPQTIESGFWWIPSDTEQSHVVMGLPAPIENSNERMASIVLQQYLGGGMSSVLFNEIREKKGWAYTVYANALHFLDTSLFMIYAGVKLDRIQDTIAIIHRELKKVSREGIPLADLKRIQESFLCTFDLSLETSESRVMAVSQAELFFKKQISYKDYKTLVLGVQSSHIQALVQKWMSTVDFSVLVLSEKIDSKKAQKDMQKLAQRITHSEIQFLKS